MPDTYALKITSAVVIGGEIKKQNAIVHLNEREAKDLLHRGKAVVATDEDAPAVVSEAAATDEAPIAVQQRGKKK